jgi:hypothetical protein
VRREDRAGQPRRALRHLHYAVHALLWKLAHGLEIPEHVSTGQLAIAARGYKAAVEAGTAARIPNDGRDFAQLMLDSGNAVPMKG